MSLEPSNLRTSSFIRCGAVCDPDAENEVASGCACCGLYLLALRCANRSDKVSIFASTVAANFANNSSIFSDDRAFDLVPSAIRLSLCSMKAPMISSLRGLGNLRDMRDLWELEGTRREKENASSERKTRRRKGLERKEEKLLDFSIFLQGLLQLIYMCEGPQLTASG